MPSERGVTIRHAIMALLGEGKISAREISAAVGVREKDVYSHLEHIEQSCRREKRRLEITPACCKGCGFVFRKRSRLTRPGRCPVCQGTAMDEPLYHLS